MRPETVRDPVCGMRFTPDQARHVYDWRGERLHFCCENCLRSFLEDPRRYLQRDQEVTR